jgi:hypothetical protein
MDMHTHINYGIKIHNLTKCKNNNYKNDRKEYRIKIHVLRVSSGFYNYLTINDTRQKYKLNLIRIKTICDLKCAVLGGHSDASL